MKKEDEYLRQASEAQKWAAQSKSEKAKAAWFRIAAGWLSLLRGLPVQKESLERLARERDTNPTGSQATHEAVADSATAAPPNRAAGSPIL